MDQVVPVNVTKERQYGSEGRMLTQDENIVELQIVVQYNISDVKAFVLNVRDPEFSLRQATESALRHVVGSTRLDQVLSEGRGQISDEVKVKLQSYLDNYGTGIQVVKITIQEARPPAQVKAAFDDVIKAKEDEERLKNEASAYANGIVPEARGRAQRMLEEAAAYRGKVVAEAQGEAQRFEKLLAEYRKAPEVTRERLYLDAVQRVMSATLQGAGGRARRQQRALSADRQDGRGRRRRCRRAAPGRRAHRQRRRGGGRGRGQAAA